MILLYLYIGLGALPAGALSEKVHWSDVVVDSFSIPVQNGSAKGCKK
jgi:hypothetical protein